MAIIEKITSNGAKVTSSLAGGLSINEASGELVIRNGETEVVRLDKDGFQYYDSAGTKRISAGQNADGQQQIVVYDEGGIPVALIGQDPKDGSPVIAQTDGSNVFNDLMAG